MLNKKDFLKYASKLAFPIMIQNLIGTLVNIADTVMLGYVSQTAMSASSLANQYTFILFCLYYGMAIGTSVLCAQYWGKGDVEAINRCMGVALYIGVAVAAIMALVLFCFPTFVMGLVTNNTLLIEMGAPYLRIVGISYIFNAASAVYVGMQRSTENPVLGMVVFAASMLLNTFLNYILIFGKFGAPALGITGAALATLTARVVEFLLTWTYALRDHRVPLRLRAMLRPGRMYFNDFLQYSAPVLINESMWGLGTTVMTAIMGHMVISEEILAAYAIMGNIDKFSTVTCFGIAGASAVLVGKRIGEGASREETYDLSWCMLLVSLFIGFTVAACLAILLPTVFIPYLYPLFHLEGLSLNIATIMCTVYVVMLPLKSFDINNITGILRAGGDARMASVIDLAPLWLVAVPLTALTGLVLNAPVWVVCLCIQVENICKMPLGVRRLRSRKWINNITRENPS